MKLERLRLEILRLKKARNLTVIRGDDANSLSLYFVGKEMPCWKKNYNGLCKTMLQNKYINIIC